MFLRGRTMVSPTIQSLKSHQQPKEKIIALPAFSFAKSGAKEKAIKKKTPKEDFALCGARPPLSVDATAF